jgi:membrane-bound lytic murein transglycosylase F
MNIQDATPTHIFRLWLAASAALFVLISCNRGTSLSQKSLTAIEKIRKQNSLVVLTRMGQTSYYLGRDGYTGYEYDLAQSFAAYLGVEAEFVTLDSTQEVLQSINANGGHIAAANLTRTLAREKSYVFGPNYLKVRQQVVGHRNMRLPKKIEDLVNYDIEVIQGSSYEETLQGLKTQFPDLQWRSVTEMDTESLLQEAATGEGRLVIADSNIVSVYQRYFPDLRVAFDLGEPEDHAWILSPEMEGLQPQARAWFSGILASGEWHKIHEKHYGYVRVFDYVDLRAFRRRIESRLPRYQEHFKAAAEAQELDWTLLAAQAYQESHWRRNAISPTGVRGIMMLTRRTAKQLGVTDRTDPVASIKGGARYLRQLRDRLPEEIAEPDRTFISLAAYNVGFGHVKDAQRLAERKGLNPYLWSDLVQVLPLLSKRKYYKTLRFGYARGWEPVQYVTRIRDYRNILERSLAVEALAGEDP